MELRKQTWGVTKYFDLPGPSAFFASRLADKPSRRAPLWESLKLPVRAISAGHRQIRFNNGLDLTASWPLKSRVTGETAGKGKMGRVH